MFINLINYHGLALTLLRLVLSAIFVSHGWGKLKDLKGTARGFDSMGFKPGNFWGTLTAIVEFFGGLALLLGIYHQAAALLVAVVMFVSLLWKIKNGQKLVGGFELDLALLAAALILATVGATPYSLNLF